MSSLHRRTFVFGGLAAAAGVTAFSAGSARAAIAYPFRLGVASGDPLPDGVVLWTRLAPTPLNGDGHGGMPNQDFAVDWQVATDEAMTQVVASGSVTARFADAHSVHVEVGGLAPGSVYFYRFRADGHLSPVGRTRTAPALTTVGSMTMAFTSCSRFEDGFFTVFRRMAEDRPDLILHLGDYIYEGGASSGRPRTHVPSTEITSLANYRVRHAQHRTDADLQTAHAIAPWLVVWDDHEVENNYAGLVRENNSPPGDFRARRAAAYQAYYEHMPLRQASRPVNGNMQLYRRIRWGRLATFHMLDTRQFRDDQACGDGVKVCPAAGAANRSITGGTQEAWLLDGLGQHLGTWDILGQQVFFANQIRNTGGGTSMDQWDGYLASRERIQRGWVNRQVRNPVVLTGDIHTHYANNLLLDYADQSAPPIGVELVSSSATTGGNGSGLFDFTDHEATAYSEFSDPGIAVNEHIKFRNGRRGYVRTRFDSTRMLVDFRAVDRIDQPGHPARTLASFAVQEGRPGLQRL